MIQQKLSPLQMNESEGREGGGVDDKLLLGLRCKKTSNWFVCGWMDGTSFFFFFRQKFIINQKKVFMATSMDDDEDRPVHELFLLLILILHFEHESGLNVSVSML